MMGRASAVRVSDASMADLRGNTTLGGSASFEYEVSCGGSDFEIVEGRSEPGARRILEGLAEWLGLIRSGAWGHWLQARLETLVSLLGRGVRDARLTLDGSEGKQKETSSHIFEAWKLMKIVFSPYAPDLLAGEVLVHGPIPELLASFSKGKLHGVGKLQFDEAPNLRCTSPWRSQGVLCLTRPKGLRRLVQSRVLARQF
ncbi:unnamed protein product [Polarella glacialis]|uniref:Uncharacterized protein n=1 Tax=Polarella glacialis TaxID=89957 RepID=A0A813G3Z3_POLGL|nr:unnamed protein product [Polarella glacialis]CAE8720128.1 unnamed protein product [Polarella glacialis]